MADPEKNASSMQRVKVYRWNEDGQWDDQGTGHVSIDYLEQSEDIGLYVIDEDDNETLLVHRISTDIVYTKPEDTIISWRDTESSDELALSFQETAGCSHVWNHISSMQRILHFNSLNSETFHNVNNDLKELPNVDLSTLPQLLELVTESGITDERLTELILKDVEFFQKLIAVFENCETMNNVDSLHMMFNIVKGIISLNSAQILEIILGDQLIMKIIGCLEYDPNVPQSQHHRNYLRDHVLFREAIPIKDPLVLSKIHQTYRIGYLKDVVLDGATSANLQSVINANTATIVTLLKNDNIIQELFASLRSPSTSVESRNNLVGFLHEFCSLSKSLDLPQKLELFEELIKDGIFDIIALVLQSPDKKLVLAGTEILSTLLMQDNTILHSYLSRPEFPLLGLLVKGMMEDFGEVMRFKFVDLFQNILEWGGAQQKIIMDILCEKHIPELVDFITASCPEDPGDPSEDACIRVSSHRSATREVLLNISEFLCFCVRLESSRKNFFLNNVTQILHLTRRKEKPIKAAAIRFLRNLLSDRDDDVDDYIVENNTLKPIIDVFVAGGHQDNLLTSAILELFEHIRMGRQTVMLRYIVDTFWDQLAPFEHLPSVLALKTTYEKYLESMGPKSTTDPVDMRGNEPVVDEEKSASASSVVSATPSKRSRGLVDYEDDEDDEEQDQSKRLRLSSTSEETPPQNKVVKQGNPDNSRRQQQ